MSDADGLVNGIKKAILKTLEKVQAHKNDIDFEKSLNLIIVKILDDFRINKNEILPPSLSKSFNKIYDRNMERLLEKVKHSDEKYEEKIKINKQLYYDFYQKELQRFISKCAEETVDLKEQINASDEQIASLKSQIAAAESSIGELKESNISLKKFSTRPDDLRRALSSMSENDISEHIKHVSKLVELTQQILVEKVSRRADENLCVCCSLEKKNVVLFPCTHMCVCEKCALLIDSKCPLCREDLQYSVKVFV